MILLDGKALAKNILEQLKTEISRLPFQPLFCDVLVGDDPVSLSYVKIKGKTAESAGLKFLLQQFPPEISQTKLLEEVSKLNIMPNMCGLIAQLPLPPHLDKQVILNAINPQLDVDCLGGYNSQNFYAGRAELLPPTAAAILSLIDQLPENYKSGKFLVIGQGQLVGKPVSFLLKQRGYNAAVADRATADLSALSRTADVLISATGQANLVTKDWIKPGAAVIDAGTAETDGGITGDVDFESVKNVAGYLTPVPGGVGPLTVVMLLKNVTETAKGRHLSA